GQEGAPRRRNNLPVAHETVARLTETKERGDAIAEQQKKMLAVVSDERPWDYIEEVYLTGTIDEIQRRIQERIDVGVEELFLHTMTADLAQLDLFARHLLEPFKSAVPSRASS